MNLTLHPREHWSHNAAKTTARCQRLALFEQGWRVRPKGSDRAPLAYGRAIHAGITHAFMHDVPSAMSAFSALWPDSLADERRNADRAMATFRCADHYALPVEIIPPPAGARPDDETLSPWEVDLWTDLDMPVPLLSRIDAIGRDKSTGEIVPIDYKTASYMAGQFAEVFRTSTQLMSYCLALRVALGQTGNHPASALVVGLRTSTSMAEVLPLRYTYQPFQLTWCLEWLQRTCLAYLREQFKLGAGDPTAFPPDFTGCTPWNLFDSQGYECPFATLCHGTAEWTDLLHTLEPST